MKTLIGVSRRLLMGSPMAAFMAPTLEPTTISAVTPRATSARNIPTCTEPKLPPPASTKAIFDRFALSGTGDVVCVTSAVMGDPLRDAATLGEA